MRLWLRDPLAILAEGAARGLVVEDGRIAELVPAGGAPAAPVEATFDASGHVVLPGLVNAHHHFYQTLTRAHPRAMDSELFAWLTALYPLWARLTEEDLRLAARVALVELLMSGCTCAADHHYLYPAGLERAVDVEVEEARALGVRLVVTRGSMDLSRKDGGLPPDEVVQGRDEILADCERVLRLFHDPAPGAMARVALAPCSPFSASRGLMEDAAALAARADCRLHTHLAETADEDEWCRRAYGLRPLDLLDDVGWLTDRTWLAHGVHFDDG
ncbi:MAG: amidohydrolase family protein, partial [Hyphomicrobiales bacterium]|nr:amidohydrolase family protein [Hyphomicrobiales bacterium]